MPGERYLAARDKAEKRIDALTEKKNDLYDKYGSWRHPAVMKASETLRKAQLDYYNKYGPSGRGYGNIRSVF